MTKPQSDKKKFEFSAILLVADRPTLDKRVYPRALLNSIAQGISPESKIIIQEMSPIERKAKGISISEPWKEKAMADVEKAEVSGDALVFHAICRQNKEGRKLEGIVKAMGTDSLEFFPIGYGTKGKNNVINQDYKLSYIAIEPKRKMSPFLTK